MGIHTQVPNVEKHDLTSGKIARAFSGAFDIINEGPNTGNSRHAPCRAIVAAGAVVITGTDGVNVTLPDTGGHYEWCVQALAIVSGDGVVLY